MCKRSGFSLTNARTPSLTTHIHADDLARGTSTAKPAQAVNTVIRELNYSLTQHTAIRRFALDTNQENYNLLVEAGVSISNSDYLRYSREQGWA